MVQHLPDDGAALTVDRVETGLGNSDFTIPAQDIFSFQATQKAAKPMDKAEIAIENAGYQYTTGDRQVGIGDRVTFFVKAGDTSAYGYGPYGHGPFGGARAVGTYRVSHRNIIEHAGQPTDLALDLTDWVFSTLAITPVSHGEIDRPIAGSSDAHVDTILREVDHVDGGSVPTVSATVDYFVRGKYARDAIDELASLAAAEEGPIVQRSYRNDLVFQPIEDIAPVRDTPFPGGTFGPLSSSTSDKNLVNWIRMSGGIDDRNQIDDSQTTVDSYTAPTDSNRLTVQVSVRKSELSTIELYTEAETSDEGIRPRLQTSNSDDTAPIAPGDTESDIVTGEVKEENLTAAGWTAWQLPEHTINAPNPWLIIDSPGPNSTGVGVDSNGVPAFRAYFPKPIESVIEDRESQSQYGTYGGYQTRESLVTEPAVSSRGRAILQDQGHPNTTLGPVPALTDDAHALVVGDVVPFDRPELGAEGEFIVTSKDDQYSGVTLETELEFVQLDTYA
jgi:hypothetical protein